jgi:hypothetical protein
MNQERNWHHSNTRAAVILFLFHLILCYVTVYDGKGTLEEGETAEARFIKIQAAYELLIDGERRRAYDREHHVNPMKV